MVTKKEVMDVLTGRSHLTKIEYKGIVFNYATMTCKTLKQAKEYIEKRISE